MNWNEIREDFPLLKNYPDVAYLDNAATLQKPNCVIEREKQFYLTENANPLRGLYQLAVTATDAYEKARETVRDFIHAKHTEEIIFTRNASESLNLVSYTWGSFLKEGDEILISTMEHHSNLIPWQQAAKRTGARLVYIACNEEGFITEEAFKSALTDRTRIVSMTHISNVLGTRNDIRRFAQLAHEKDAVFICDGAQSVPHISVNIQDLDVDFLSFSGHKMGAPMGIGVLYGKKELLEKMPPFLFGGEMIEYVTRDEATWAELPHKFEAGTVNAAGACALAEAIRFYQSIGMNHIEERESELGSFAFEQLRRIPHLKILGSSKAADHHGIFTFLLEGVHPHDIAEILSADGICIRAGHHCAQVLMQQLKTPSTARASLAFYNTEEEIIRLAESLKTVRRRMGYAD
ncbi:MAG: SufS family cysteine desulfurase [Firmicutes bacterium]|nr:SufS family cysteine desulfurase [Bacillota bacterium]